jgi:hypothetical protein
MKKVYMVLEDDGEAPWPVYFTSLKAAHETVCAAINDTVDALPLTILELVPANTPSSDIPLATPATRYAKTPVQ